MGWFGWVLCIIGYFIIGSLAACLLEYSENGRITFEDYDIIFTGLFLWPLLIVAVIVFGIPYIIYVLVGECVRYLI